MELAKNKRREEVSRAHRGKRVPGALHSVHNTVAVGDVSLVVGVAVQPPHVQRNLSVGGLKVGGGMPGSTHHELCECVPPVAAGVLLQKG